MKKLFLTMAVAAMTAGVLTSCGSKAATAADEGEALKAKIENCSNPDSLKVYVEQAKEYAKKLEAEGKGQDAEAYLDEIIPAVKAKDASVASYFEELKDKAADEVNNVKEGVDSVATSAVDAAKEAGENVKEAGENAVNSAKEAAANAVDAAKEKVANAADAAKEKAANAVDAAKEKATNAADAAKEKASNAAQKEADKVKNLLK